MFPPENLIVISCVWQVVIAWGNLFWIIYFISQSNLDCSCSKCICDHFLKKQLVCLVAPGERWLIILWQWLYIIEIFLSSKEWSDVVKSGFRIVSLNQSKLIFFRMMLRYQLYSEQSRSKGSEMWAVIVKLCWESDNFIWNNLCFSFYGCSTYKADLVN